MKRRMTYQQMKEAARLEAMDWQEWLHDHSVSYEGLFIATALFEKLGRRYGLLAEFRENAII